MVTPLGAFRDGRLTAYATSTAIWPFGHGVAESDEDLRVVKPMSLMSTGEYHEPQGAWYPSVIY